MACGGAGCEPHKAVEAAVTGPPNGGTGAITIYFIAIQVMAVASFAVAWWKGGRVERLGAAILICDALLTTAIVGLAAPGVHRAAMMVQILTALGILWLTLRFDRWWLFVASGALILCGLVTVLEMLNPALSLYAAVSAQLGLWALVYLSLLAGAGERWLAGECSARDTAVWSRRRIRAS